VFSFFLGSPLHLQFAVTNRAIAKVKIDQALVL